MALGKKNRNCVSCVESHSLRAGCIVCDVKNGPTKMMMKLKDLLITLYVTSASALCEYVLIVIINEIALLLGYRPRLKSQQNISILAFY